MWPTGHRLAIHGLYAHYMMKSVLKDDSTVKARFTEKIDKYIYINSHQLIKLKNVSRI